MRADTAVKNAMPRASQGELLQGTLPLLILRTLSTGPNHGFAIARRIQQISKAVLRVEQGSLYPALHRMELDGLIAVLLGDDGEQPPSQGTTGSPHAGTRRSPKRLRVGTRSPEPSRRSCRRASAGLAVPLLAPAPIDAASAAPSGVERRTAAAPATTRGRVCRPGSDACRRRATGRGANSVIQRCCRRTATICSRFAPWRTSRRTCAMRWERCGARPVSSPSPSHCSRLESAPRPPPLPSSTPSCSGRCRCVRRAGSIAVTSGDRAEWSRWRIRGLRALAPGVDRARGDLRQFRCDVSRCRRRPCRTLAGGSRKPGVGQLLSHSGRRCRPRPCPDGRRWVWRR